jgi:HEAT repeat protein
MTPLRTKPHRFPASVTAMAVLFALSAAMLLWNRYEFVRDAKLAKGRSGPEQEEFFLASESRPDLLLFFRDLRPEERVATARNLARYPRRESAAVATRLLETFDERARAELTRSLSKLAEIEPKWVASELGRTMSFQTDGVFQALRGAGDRAVRAVAESLEDPGLRAGAQRFLAECGNPATPYLLPLLDHVDEGVRIAAATTLAKVGARSAAPRIAELFSSAKGDARLEYLTALSLLGDGGSTPIFASIAASQQASRREIDLAARGLGKVATPAALEILERMASSHNEMSRSAAIQGLSLSGDAGLRPGLDSRALALVARSIRSERSDEALRGLVLRPTGDRQSLLLSLEACQGRPALAGSLMEFCLAADPGSDGDLLDAATEALASTEKGRAYLRTVGPDSPLFGFAARALLRAAGGSA